jgi:hypothetical protein
LEVEEGRVTLKEYVGAEIVEVALLLVPVALGKGRLFLDEVPFAYGEVGSVYAGVWLPYVRFHPRMVQLHHYKHGEDRGRR